MFDHSSYQIPQRLTSNEAETVMTPETHIDLHKASDNLLSLDAARALRAAHALSEANETYAAREQQVGLEYARSASYNLSALRREATQLEQEAA